MKGLSFPWFSPWSSMSYQVMGFLLFLGAHLALSGLKAQTQGPQTSLPSPHPTTLQILSKKVARLNKPPEPEGSANVAPPPLRQNLMIYPSGASVVTDLRTVDLVAGNTLLKINYIPAKFQKDSLLVRALNEQTSVVVTECSFDATRLTFLNLLEKSVGHTVYVLSDTQSSQKGHQTGRLMAIDRKKALVNIDDQIQTVHLDKIAFRKIPASLSIFPILRLGVQSPSEGPETLELTYLTQGLSWDAYYTVEISPHTQTANMMGWIAIQNTSGTDFRNAHIQLATSPSSKGLAPLTPLSPQSSFNPIPTPISLYDGAVKKVSFFSAFNVVFSKEYHLALPPAALKREEASKPLAVKVWCAIKHSPQGEQNSPLPSGPVRVYLKTPLHTKDAGKFFIPYTNIGERFSLPLEKCSSITAQIQQLSFRQQTGESAFLVMLTNKNTQPVVVHIMQKLSPQTSLLSSSVDSYKIIAETIQWSVEIPANESISLRYRTRFDQNTATHRDA